MSVRQLYGDDVLSPILVWLNSSWNQTQLLLNYKNGKKQLLFY